MAYNVTALLVGLFLPLLAVETEKLLFPTDGNPKFYAFFGSTSFAIIMAYVFLGGAIFNFIEIRGKVRGLALCEFVIVWFIYSKLRKIR